MSREDEKLDAAEYVIGTLSGAERAAFEMLVAADKQTQEDVSFWERTFGALNASVAPVIPGQYVWEKISTLTGGTVSVGGSFVQDATSVAGSGISPPVIPTGDVTSSKSTSHVRNDAAAGQTRASTGLASPSRGAATTTDPTNSSSAVANDNIKRLKSSRSRWRWGAVAAGIAALAFGATTFDTSLRDTLVAKYMPSLATDSGKSFIAVVNSPDQPALIVKVNSKTQEVSVRSLGMNRPEGKSLELWYVPEGEKAISVGLVGEGDINLGETPANDGDLLAISLEPQGGSPTGVATGPIVYTGKLIEDIGSK